MVKEKMDSLIDKVVSISYYDGNATISFLMKITGYDRYMLWGEDLASGGDGFVEELVLLRKRCVGFSIIKDEKVEDMIKAYQPPIRTPDLNIN